MKRKVNRVGINTLTVSLPSKWVKSNNINAGDELDCIEKTNSIAFIKGEKKQKAREITLDINEFNKYTLARYLPVLYRSNFSKITLLYSKSEIFDPKNNKNFNIKDQIKRFCNRFIGMDLISQTSAKSEIICFVPVEEGYIQNIENRILFLLKETINEMISAIDKNEMDEFNQTVKINHDNIVKFINYYLRMLDSTDKNEYEKKQLNAAYLMLDILIDKIRQLSEKLAVYGCTPKTKKYMQEIFELFFEQIDGMNRGKITHEHVLKIYKLVEKIKTEKFTIGEYKVISIINIFKDTLNFFYEAAIIKGMKKQFD